MSQHCPTKRIGFGQSAGGQMTRSHCAMADCDWEETTRNMTAAVSMMDLCAVEAILLGDLAGPSAELL